MHFMAGLVVGNLLLRAGEIAPVTRYSTWINGGGVGIV
jgi:hypothetical protein